MGRAAVLLEEEVCRAAVLLEDATCHVVGKPRATLWVAACHAVVLREKTSRMAKGGRKKEKGGGATEQGGAGRGIEDHSGGGLKEHRSNPDHVCEAAKVALFQAAHAKQLRLSPTVYGRELAAQDMVPERPGFLVLVPELLSRRECGLIVDIIERVCVDCARLDANCLFRSRQNLTNPSIFPSTAIYLVHNAPPTAFRYVVTLPSLFHTSTA